MCHHDSQVLLITILDHHDGPSLLIIINYGDPSSHWGANAHRQQQKQKARRSTIIDYHDYHC